jgi:5'-3' exonuclease
MHSQDVIPSTCSSVKGIGKKTAWETWRVFPEITPVFQSLSQCPAELTEEQLCVIQSFTILMYKCTSNEVEVNEARLRIFTQGQRQIDNIPPTKAALAEHTRKAMCGVKQ